MCNKVYSYFDKTPISSRIIKYFQGKCSNGILVGFLDPAKLHLFFEDKGVIEVWPVFESSSFLRSLNLLGLLCPDEYQTAHYGAPDPPIDGEGISHQSW